MNKKTQSPIYDNPAELLRQLIRFDTTNPPGNERECILFINGLLKEAGIRTTLLGRNRQRQNVIARLKGEGKAPPLLLYGHVDVVTTEKQKWQQPCLPRCCTTPSARPCCTPATRSTSSRPR